MNPIAAILAGQMMLHWLGEKPKAAAIKNAVAEVIREGRVRTYDMGGNASTTDMTEAICDAMIRGGPLTRCGDHDLLNTGENACVTSATVSGGR